MNSFTRLLLFVLLAIVGVKLSEQVYALVAFADERAAVRVLQERLLDVGAASTVTREEVRRIRETVEAEDRKLEEEHRHLRRYDRMTIDGTYLPSEVYAGYKAELEAYNRHVVERNALNARLREIQDRYVAAMEQYGVLADSIRDLAAIMGEPYYSVPTPAEASILRSTPRPAP